MQKDQSVCVLGLGYVGLTLATVMAEVGYKVLGIEIREDIVRSLKEGLPHFFEPGLQHRMGRVLKNERLQIMSEIPSKLDSTVYILTVGTPLDGQKKSRLDLIENATREVAKVLKANDLVVLRSTVQLHTTRNVVAPILAATGHDFHLAFCPERTLEGEALEELRKLPQIVGGLTSEASRRASALFQELTPTVVRVQTPETAEMIKLVDNAQRDVLFGYSNEVARLCDCAGISAHEVIQAGRLGYPRHILAMPGPVGGPCLEKDSYILQESVQRLGGSADITMLARHLNEKQPQEIAAFLSQRLKALPLFSKTPKISLLGLAFKGRPQTDDLRGTMAIPSLAALKQQFPRGEFYGFDAVVDPQKIESLGLIPATTPDAAFNKADLVIILNNHPLFSSLDLESLANSMSKPSCIYDMWNTFSSRDLSLPSEVAYIALGNHSRGQV